jgi:hypothetical protein
MAKRTRLRRDLFFKGGFAPLAGFARSPPRIFRPKKWTCSRRGSGAGAGDAGTRRLLERPCLQNALGRLSRAVCLFQIETQNRQALTVRGNPFPWAIIAVPGCTAEGKLSPFPSSSRLRSSAKPNFFCWVSDFYPARIGVLTIAAERKSGAPGKARNPMQQPAPQRPQEAARWPERDRLEFG